MRLGVDTGGTFTDLVLDDGESFRLFKSPTVAEDPVRGVLDVLEVAASELDVPLPDLLGRGECFIHGTTRAINAVLTHTTARTAFLTTRGHPDVLVFREGGRTRPFDFTRQYPGPYVPRSLTFEIPERIGAGGVIVRPLDEKATVATLRRLAEKQVEAIAVSFLWSTVNPTHERRVGELIEQHLPGVPYTLGHALNPTLREYRRASAAAIDASLKPVMSAYLSLLEQRLRDVGFRGRVLVVTSNGGMLDAAAVAAAPIHSVNSGPAMAPVAGRHYATMELGEETAIVADTGGTSYDVSLVRRGRIPWTRQTYLGAEYESDLTGFPSVDVQSIGAGGGSIAWVDDGDLLHVGPQSAGAEPGPVCYGLGGRRPTVTDAALVLGYVDVNYFMGGSMRLDEDAARAALTRDIGAPLALTTTDAAAAVLRLATEHMVRAIEDITLNRGVDPRSGVLIGGGGAAGINAVAIARRLGCSRVVFPDVGAALSAAGALMSDLTAQFDATLFTSTDAFAVEDTNAVLDQLVERCRTFARGPGAGASATAIELSAEARYPSQVWELEVPLRVQRFASQADVEQFRRDFHDHHMEVFAMCDEQSPVEVVGWRARVSCRVRPSELPVAAASARGGAGAQEVADSRRVHFPDTGVVDASVWLFHTIDPAGTIEGPAIIESPVTTIVIDPGTVARRSRRGSLIVDLGCGCSRTPAATERAEA